MMKKNILYVLHSLSGGTYYTTLDLIKNITNDYCVYVLGANKDYLTLYKFEKQELNVISTFQRNSKWSSSTFHDSWLTYLYYEIITKFNINLIHIRHLIFHSFDLPQIAKKLNIPVVLSFHDFYFLCPNYLLLNENEEYCELNCSNSNENCKLQWDLFDDIHFKTILPIWRKEVEKLFTYTDIFITTSEIVKNLYLSIYNIDETKFYVFEHGRDFPTINDKLYELPSKDKPLKIAIPANQLNNSKGLQIIKKLKMLDNNDYLEFHFLGNATNLIENYGVSHGPYNRDDFYTKIKSIKPSFIGIFSIWPETFCHTLTEAWSCGIPTIGTNIGVIEDRIIKSSGGFLIDRNNMEHSYEKILEYKNAPNQTYLDLIKNVSNMKFKTTEQMSNEYLKTYNNLLKSNKE